MVNLVLKSILSPSFYPYTKFPCRVMKKKSTIIIGAKNLVILAKH